MPELYFSGPAALISALYDDLKIGDTIDEMVNWDREQCKLSPGTRVKAMVINVFGRRRPLSRIDEFYTDKDLENLLGKGVGLDDLTDYNLARGLDKLAERGPHEIYSTLCLRAICSEQVALNFLHNDTTSISVCGDYDEQAEYPLLAHGHSKDRRPDLKQFIYGLSVTQDRIPVCAEVKSGNLDDKSWNFGYIEKLARVFKPEALRKMIYVADSALVTEPNLEKLIQHELKFISRLPGTFAVEKTLKEQAWQEGNFSELGAYSTKKNAATYRAVELPGNINGRDYRFFVVHSSKLDKTKERSLNKKLDDKNSKLKQEIKKMAGESFACEPDAETALVNFCKKHGDEHFTLSGQVVTEEKRKPGRPGKNSTTTAVYRLKLSHSLDEAAIHKTRERLSCFVLITNLDQSYSAHRVLKEYKAQSNVEVSFKFLKDPLFVGPVFLKRPDRIEALAYVLLIALLIYSLLERRVREALKHETEPLLIPGKVETFTPTGRKILESLEFVMVMTTDDPNRRAFGSRYKLPRVVELAGFSPDIYLDVKERKDNFT